MPRQLFCWSLLILFCLLCSVQGAEFKKEGEVLVLSDSDLEQAIQAHENIFIEFYATWCGHCQELNPKWTKIAKQYKDKGSSVVFAKIDADKNKKAGKKYNIEGFPTLIFFSKGKKYEYSDENEIPQLDKFLKKLTQDPVTHQPNVAKEVAEGDKIALFLASTEGSAYKVFSDTCKAHDHIECFSTLETPETRELLLGQVSPVGIYLVKRKGHKVVPFPGPVEPKSLDSFFNDHRFELIVQATDLESLDQIFERKAPPALVGFFKDESSAEAKAFSDFAHEIGHKGGLLFYSCHLLGKSPDDLAALSGVDTFNSVVLLKGSASYEIKKYRFDRPVTVENLRAFFSEYKDKKIPVYYRSEEVPSSQAGPVFKMTARSEVEFHPNPNENWVLYVHEDNCKKCDKLSPIFERLAEKYTPRVKFVSVDVGKNDLQKVEFSEVPSVLFFRRGKKLASHYFGKAREADLEGYLLKQFPELTTQQQVETDL